MILYEQENLPEVNVTAEAPEGLEYMNAYRAANPMTPYSGSSYLERFKPERYSLLRKNYEEDYNNKVRTYARARVREDKIDADAQRIYNEKLNALNNNTSFWNQEVVGMNQTPESKNWSLEAQAQRQAEFENRTPGEHALNFGIEAALAFIPELGIAKWASMGKKAYAPVQYASKTEDYFDLGSVFSKELKGANAPSVFPKENYLVLSSTGPNSPLAGQVSKAGRIRVDNIRKLIANRNFPEAERTHITNILDTKFPGETNLNFEKFKKVVNDELIPLKVQKNPTYIKKDYTSEGLDRIGFSKKTSDQIQSDLLVLDEEIREFELSIGWMHERIKDPSKIVRTITRPDGSVKYERYDLTGIYSNTMEEALGDEYRAIKYWETHRADAIQKRMLKQAALPNSLTEHTTIAYSNAEQLGPGSTTHFKNPATLGHSRYFSTAHEPTVVNVLEDQSDWAQKVVKTGNTDIDKLQRKKASLLKFTEEEIARGDPYSQIGRFKAQLKDVNKSIKDFETLEADKLLYPQKTLLGKSLQEERLFQEGMAYHGARGKTTMRYPTRETAIRLQDYKANLSYQEKVNHIQAEIDVLKNPKYSAEDSGFISRVLAEHEKHGAEEGIKILEDQIKTIKDKYLSKGIDMHFWPEHETILRKYSNKPSIIKKYTGTAPDIVSDIYNNSWYEFTIPGAYRGKGAAIKAFSTTGFAAGLMNMIRNEVRND